MCHKAPFCWWVLFSLSTKPSFESCVFMCHDPSRHNPFVITLNISLVVSTCKSDADRGITSASTGCASLGLWVHKGLKTQSRIWGISPVPHLLWSKGGWCLATQLFLCAGWAAKARNSCSPQGGWAKHAGDWGGRKHHDHFILVPWFIFFHSISFLFQNS